MSETVDYPPLTSLEEMPLHSGRSLVPRYLDHHFACEEPEAPLRGDHIFDWRCPGCVAAAEAEVVMNGDPPHVMAAQPRGGLGRGSTVVPRGPLPLLGCAMNITIRRKSVGQALWLTFIEADRRWPGEDLNLIRLCKLAGVNSFLALGPLVYWLSKWEKQDKRIIGTQTFVDLQPRYVWHLAPAARGLTFEDVR